MAITASEITTSNTLEQFRAQFNNLVTDVGGIEGGTLDVAGITADTTNTTTLNVKEDGTIIFEGATDDSYETTLTVTDPTADRTITLPNETGTVLTDASSINATTFTVSANNATSETVYPIFVDGATGTQGAESDTGLSYNPSTELLTVGKIVISNDGNIGSVGDTDAIAIDSAGIVTLSNSLVVSGSTTLSGPYSTLTTNSQLRFRDSDIHIQSNADGDLDITADDEIELNSTLIDINGNVEISGTTTLSSDITVGALLKMPTVTAGYLLVGDGTSYEEVAVSGDVTMASGGAVTIAANAVEGSMLNTDTISAQTALTSGLATTDELLVSDAGTLKRMDVSVLSTLTDGNATALAIALG